MNQTQYRTKTSRQSDILIYFLFSFFILFVVLNLIKLDPNYRLVFGEGGSLNASTDMDYMVKQIEQLCGKKDAEGFRKYVLDNRKKLKLSKNCLNSPWTSWTNLANKRALRVAQVLRPWRSVASDLSKFFDDDRMQLAMSFQTKYLGMSPFQAPSLFTILSFLELEYGIYHAKGGLGTVTERMGALAEELGVEICLNEPVEECLFDGKKIVGVTPKGFRDRAATVLRSNNMNEAVVVALLGHTPNSISMAYGATPWKELKRAVKLL